MRVTAAITLLLIAAGPCEAQSAQPSAAGQQTLDLEHYVAELNNVAADAIRLKDHPDEAGAVKGRLPAEWVVTENGQKYAIPTNWLREELSALEVDHRRAREVSGDLVARLSAMRSGAQSMAGTRPVAPDLARHRLNEILKRHEYRGVTGPSQLKSWWDRATDWIADKLAALFSEAGRHRRISAAIVWLLAAGVGVFLIVWLVRAMLRSSSRTSLKLDAPPPGENNDWAHK